jgi:hypothetical protein
MRTPLIALCVLAAATLARADAPAVEFDGQRYHLDYQDQAKLADGRQGDGLAEFTLEGENVNNWTKLFAYYVFPESGDDPTLMAQEVGKATKEQNPDANFAVIANKETGDAIIDFLTWAPNSDVMEFNVFKYARAEYGPGLVALQYAQRFKLGDLSVEAFRALRSRAVAAMAQSDIGQARTYFAEKAKEQLGSARAPTQVPEARPAPPAGADH